jgi:hypothetical protein
MQIGSEAHAFIYRYIAVRIVSPASPRKPCGPWSRPPSPPLSLSRQDVQRPAAPDEPKPAAGRRPALFPLGRRYSTRLSHSSEVATLNWIGKEAVVNHHRQVPYRLLHCGHSRIGKARLKELGVMFKQVPWEVRAG